MSTFSASGKPNILFMIADDLGQDLVKESGVGSTHILEVVTCDENGVEIRGRLDNISLFFRNGLAFKQAWAHPACSPTRASIYTGVHPWKHGVGSPGGNPELPDATSLITLPEMLPTDYACGLFGKWHLGERAGAYPTDHGWDRHIGTLEGRLPNGYNDWELQDSDIGYDDAALQTDHATWVTVREAASWINGLHEDTPWFATIAFHAPHEPFHIPLDPTSGSGIGFNPNTPGDVNSNAYMFNVMTQNMDYHIGRLIGRVSGGFGGRFDFDPISSAQLANTVIIFIGDNGSPSGIAKQEPKGRIYEGGIRVPMIVADGRAVLKDFRNPFDFASDISPLHLAPNKLNTSSRQLVHVVDLYKTIVRLTDPSASDFPSNIDSQDLSPLFKMPGSQPPVRRYNFSQFYNNNQKIATIRNLDYKLNYLDPNYSLYKYDGNQIPGIEDNPDDPTDDPDDPADLATNLFDVAISGEDTKANQNLHELLNELISNYRIDQTAAPFPDPR